MIQNGETYLFLEVCHQGYWFIVKIYVYKNFDGAIGHVMNNLLVLIKTRGKTDK